MSITSRPPRIVLLTSDERRHRFLAHTLAARIELVGVVTESKPADAIGISDADSDDDACLLREHFVQRDEAEARHFGEPGPMPVGPRDILPLSRGEANAASTVDWIVQRQPDALLLFGTGIIRKPLLDVYPGRVVNLHLGLSPYYRGSGTNFWPLVNREPQCVGYTIHLAAAEVDAGPILAQGRPNGRKTDGPHDLGCRTIADGAVSMAGVTIAYLAGQIAGRHQAGEGRLYRRRDFNADAVRRMRQHFANGMMTSYLNDKAARDAAFPIVQWHATEAES